MRLPGFGDILTGKFEVFGFEFASQLSKCPYLRVDPKNFAAEGLLWFCQFFSWRENNKLVVARLNSLFWVAFVVWRLFWLQTATRKDPKRLEQTRTDSNTP